MSHKPDKENRHMHERLYTQSDLVPDFNRLNPSPTAPKIIGLAGYARSGKDTVAEIITRLYGHEQKSFAAKLKALAYDLNPYVAFPTTDKVRLQQMVDDIGWEDAKEYPEVRRTLQVLGTKVREHLGHGSWVNAAMPSHHDVITGTGFVFSDVRFPNEAAAIKGAGGVVLRVVRPGIKALNGHISETAMDNWQPDDLIMNDGSLLDLEGEVQRVLGEFE